jgi:malate synthase
MDLLKRQLLSPNYIQHSARVLFEVGQADPKDREQILQSIFDLSHDEIVKQVESGKLGETVLEVYDYIFDVYPEEEAQRTALRSTG